MTLLSDMTGEELLMVRILGNALAVVAVEAELRRRARSDVRIGTWNDEHLDLAITPAEPRKLAA